MHEGHNECKDNRCDVKPIYRALAVASPLLDRIPLEASNEQGTARKVQTSGRGCVRFTVRAFKTTHTRTHFDMYVTLSWAAPPLGGRLSTKSIDGTRLTR